MVAPQLERSTLNGNKWFNSPVWFHQGSLADIRHYIPDFERRSFGLRQPHAPWTRIHKELDMIVRKPFREDHDFVPVGVVSKEYTLVPHTQVLDVAADALQSAEINPDTVRAELEITQYGERMGLALFLPEKFAFDPGDGHPLALRLECFNSVDGSSRFRAVVGWFRFVCSNGLIIGVTRLDVRRRHLGEMQLGLVGKALSSGIAESEKEKRNFEKWRERPISAGAFVQWVEKDLFKAWGFKAATRAFHIARCAHDVEVLGPYKDNKPTTIPVQIRLRVPGSPCHMDNLYDLSQILAWLAKQRRDIQEQLEWREQIPQLLRPLLVKRPRAKVA